MPVIALSCPTCGAPLAVTPGTDSLRCAYCRNTHRVAHDNGHVSLAPLVERIDAMQTGVDRVAAELAIPRMEDEIRALASELASVDRIEPSSLFPPTRTEIYAPAIIIAVCALAFGSLAIWPPLTLILFGILIAYMGWVVRASTRRIARAETTLQARADHLKAQTLDKRAKIDAYRRMLHGKP